MHSLATCSLEPTAEGCPDTSNQRMPPKLLSTSLHPCFRRSPDFPKLPPVRSRNPSVHAAGLALAGPLDPFVEVFARQCRFAIFASDVSVVIPLRAPRPLSRANVGLNRRGHFYLRAVTQRRCLWPRDAFGRSRFERRFLTEEAAPLGDGSSRISATLEGYASSVCRRSLFAFVGSRSLLMRARCSHEASPCLRRATALRRGLRDASMEAKTRTSNFCRTFFDARAHPLELSILLRARLLPLSAFEQVNPTCVEPSCSPRAS
jgi:hypothetical protein